MNSFLSLVTSPFAANRVYAPQSPQAPSPGVFYKAPFYKASPEAAPDPHPWSMWAAAYGGETSYTGSTGASVGTFGYATGVDYGVTPYTVAGFAVAGGGTNYGLSGGLGGGHSDMFQAAFYSSTYVGAAYLAAAVAYGWHDETVAGVAGTDLTAKFAVNDVGGRIEGGYRFAIPGVLPTFGFTPYAAGQAQALRTPSYSENGSSIFALAYDASTTAVARTELGSWYDWTMPAHYDGATLTLRARTAWEHDYWSSPNIFASFVALPGSSFLETLQVPNDFLLASAGAEIRFRNGISVGAWFDGEFAGHAQEYGGMARLRYTW